MTKKYATRKKCKSVQDGMALKGAKRERVERVNKWTKIGVNKSNFTSKLSRKGWHSARMPMG